MSDSEQPAQVQPIRVLITDDHFIVRQGLRLILNTAADIECAGEAENGAEALQQTAVLQPHVILMDLRMPVMDGLTAIGQLREQHPQVAVIILTTYNEDEMMLRGLQLGARGYLLKDTDRETLLHTIRAAARGESLFKPDVLQRAFAVQAAAPAPSRTAPSAHEPLELTPRELEVLRAAATGERTKEIALRLDISARTVKAHLTSVYNKLGVDSRAAAIAIAAQKGWL
ncbi:MAG: response regulator transcription factor [Anaerolineales bacterium]|nr:response regulator transcription factor [Anaerolineales bacterium]MCB0007376.1 response regulator transcription factor [Anaerolineales bacterium]MCB0012173.1 response regulator transcription factor [Anaerolineales bacterium]MCB8959941.1 response regulator transcription factor [Ardenticatenales bacterium]